MTVSSSWPQTLSHMQACTHSWYFIKQVQVSFEGAQHGWRAFFQCWRCSLPEGLGTCSYRTCKAYLLVDFFFFVSVIRWKLKRFKEREGFKTASPKLLPTATSVIWSVWVLKPLRLEATSQFGFAVLNLSLSFLSRSNFHFAYNIRRKVNY